MNIKQKHLFTFLVVVSSVLGTSGVTYAFGKNIRWHEPAVAQRAGNGPRGGGGGIYGTGGRSDNGIQCAHCHTTAPGERLQIDAEINAPFGDRGGDLTYTPGRRYDINIRMLNELHVRNEGGPGWGNMFALTIENAAGQVVGEFEADSGSSRSCPTNPPANDRHGLTTIMYGDCHGVLSQTDLNPAGQRTSWNFAWTAPRGAGDLTLYMGMVDGNHAHDDSVNDQVIMKVIPLLQE